MDISDVNRKRINEDAEKLRENDSRESKKINELLVAKDKAYWDLKEKYDQLNKKHEGLQQNMANVQMQLETVFGQCQEELRLRTENLKKLAAARELSDVLEEYLGRLAATLARSQQDSEALKLAHARSDRIVRDLAAKHTEFAENSQRDKAALEEKYKQKLEHCAQLIRELGATRQSAVEKQRAMLARLALAQSWKEELMAIEHEMSRDLDRKKRDREAGDQKIATLRSELQRLTLELSNRCAELSNTAKELENELKEALECNEALQKALASQEEFANSICSKNNSLQQQMAEREKERAKLMVQLEEAMGQMKELTKTYDALIRDVAPHVEAKNALEKQKDQLKASAFNVTENLKSQLNIMEKRTTSIVSDLAKATEETAAKNKALKKALATSKEKLGQMERCLEEIRASKEKTKELTLTLETKTSENMSKSETIAKLKNDFFMCEAERSRLKNKIARKQKENEIERREMAARIEELEGAVRDKDQEIAKNSSIIREVRGETAKLQKTFENVEEPTWWPGSLTLLDEQDDNACMSPVKKPVEIKRLPPAPRSALRRRKGPRATTAD